ESRPVPCRGGEHRRHDRARDAEPRVAGRAGEPLELWHARRPRRQGRVRAARAAGAEPVTIAPRRRQPATGWERAYVAAAALGAGQFLWIFLMGLIAGGQFVQDAWPNWDPLAPWPVLAIPAWVTIVIGLLAAIAAVGAAVGRPPEPGAVV